ncbi:MAG: hypothetical protein JO146_02570 [Candidatus Eremiobacteraeota bacterium]|nr:hypothetical protein [Candidatus Eremiobacteraeota bacterium]
MKIRTLIYALGASLLLAACGSTAQGANPTVAALSHATSKSSHQSGHIILVGSNVQPDKKCPAGYVYCATLSAGQSVQLYFCYSPGSYCGPSQYQYTWAWDFALRKSGHLVSYFNGSFSPNPGDPSYDTISEAQGLPSTHGKYKYEQEICAYQGSVCQAFSEVGIAIK